MFAFPFSFSINLIILLLLLHFDRISCLHAKSEILESKYLLCSKLFYLIYNYRWLQNIVFIPFLALHFSIVKANEKLFPQFVAWRAINMSRMSRQKMHKKGKKLNIVIYIFSNIYALLTISHERNVINGRCKYHRDSVSMVRITKRERIGRNKIGEKCCAGASRTINEANGNCWKCHRH